jgi:integrase
MKNFKEEIMLYHLHSLYSVNLKKRYKKRLEEFLCFLAAESDTPQEEVHLEKIYEHVGIQGETKYFSGLDSSLIEQYFHENLHKSYNWLYVTKCALQSFFSYLNRKYDFPILTDEIKFNIEKYKELPKKKKKYVPTRHDLLRFLQSLLRKSNNLQRDLLFFSLLMTTGSRTTEILNTKVNDIDLTNEMIFRKQTKNKTSKYIILRDGYGPLLQRYIERFDLKKDDYLFNNAGKKMNHIEMQEVFESFLKHANLPLSTLHQLRHSFATIMAESGAEILVIQQLLGHKKIHSTKTYIDPNYIRNIGMELQVNKEVYSHLKRRVKRY